MFTYIYVQKSVEVWKYVHVDRNVCMKKYEKVYKTIRMHICVCGVEARRVLVCHELPAMDARPMGCF